MMRQAAATVLLVALHVLSLSALGATVSPGGSTGGGLLTQPNTYFVDSVAGVDPGGCTGGTYAAPWKTVGKVNSCVSTPGADVYFKSGSVFTETLTIDWPGVSENDRAIVGCYTDRSGQPIECPITLTKPIFRGTYVSSCRNPTFTCDVNNSSARPTSQYGAMVLRPKDMVYVTVRNLRIESSAGEGIQFTDGTPAIGMTPSYGIIEHNEVVEAYHTGIQYNNGATDTFGIIRDNYIDQTALIYIDTGATPWPPCLFVNGRAGPAARQRVLVERNRVNNCGGESIGILRVHGNIIRKNIVSNSRRVQVYLDNSRNNVVEQNQLYGTGAYGNPTNGQATGNAVEPYGPVGIMSDAVENMWRNNIIANGTFDALDAHVATTSTIPGQPGNPAQAGFKTGAWWYGNSVFQDSRVLRNYNLIINNNVDQLRYSTNLFQGTGDCSVQQNAPATVSYDRNQWENLPAQVDCRGSNLVNASAGVTFNWRGVDGDNVPADPSVFTPAAGTAGLNAGDPGLLTSTCLNISDYGLAYQNINRGRPPAAALWEKCMALDFFGKTRSSPPDIGAIERP